MKRVTWWPQAFLGLVFNWGALLGWVAAGRDLAAPTPLLLYAGCFFWTLGYDTIYAAADMEEDATVGVRSSARRLDGKIRSFVSGCFFFTVLCFVWALAASELARSPWAWLGWGVFACALMHQAGSLPRGKAPEPIRAIAKFRNHGTFGFLFFAGLALAAQGL